MRHCTSPHGKGVAGQSYVVFGRADGFDANFDLSSLDGTNGFVINGINRFDYAGTGVSSAGDFNGDGFDDVIVVASYANESYVIFGKAGGFDASLELSSLNGTNGFAIGDISTGYFSGHWLAGAGDINGDGFDDLIISAEEGYVLFGKADGFDASPDLSALDGTNGFVLSGSGKWGVDINDIGDLNGDGLVDLFISNNAQTYVLFGRMGGFEPDIQLTALDGRDGFACESGGWLKSVGDVNGDGIDDLNVIASNGNHVLFGPVQFVDETEKVLPAPSATMF